MKKLHLYHKWISMNIFKREQIIDVLLSDCIDEFGNTFGKNGDHFFIKTLKHNQNIDLAKQLLKKYYKKNQILSVNQLLGKSIKSKFGDMYFCPWEQGRIRPLSKFIPSHKVGPTPDVYIDKILNRLFNLFFKIKHEGFKKIFKLNNFPRCFKVRVNKQKSLYLCRDGQHRLAILSYLGYEKVKICYEADYWKQSGILRSILEKLYIYKTNNSIQELKIIDPTLAEDWPHVRLKTLTKDEAVSFFHKKFKLIKIYND